MATACVELSREIGNSVALRPFVKREVMPGNLDKARLERFVRYGVSTVSATYERRSEAAQQASIRGGIVADR